MTNKFYDNIIIGSGPAGFTALIYAKRLGLDVIMISGLEVGGLLTTTTKVDNFPGFPKGILGTELMANMESQALELGCVIIYDFVSSLTKSEDGIFSIRTLEGNVGYESKTITIATGSTPKKLSIPSEEEYINKGISYCATCDGFFYSNKNVIVIGGGDTAVEEAIYLSDICNGVTLLVRGTEMRASKILQDKIDKIPNIEVKYNVEVDEFLGDNDELNRIKLNTSEIINCDGVFIAIGHKPSTELVEELGIILDSNGYIKTLNGTSKTNIKGLFACGDVQDSKYRQAITSAGSGCKASMDVSEFLRYN